MTDAGNPDPNAHPPQVGRSRVLEPLLRLFSQPPSRELLPFDQVERLLSSRTEIPRGTQRIPLDRIVGSVGRYRDFDRAFLPLNDAVRERRDALSRADVPLPPIDVYEVGGVYFVRDGNHRVSLARARGLDLIEAHVSEMRSRAPLDPDVDIDTVIVKTEQADFLDRTALQSAHPEALIELTEPGRYELLLGHVEVHRWYLGVGKGHEVALQEATASWYENVYLPVVEAIRDSGVLHEFPDRTEADLYLWVAYHRERLKTEHGDMPCDRDVATAIAEQYSDRPLVGFVRSIARAIRAAVRAATHTPAPPPPNVPLQSPLELSQARPIETLARRLQDDPRAPHDNPSGAPHDYPSGVPPALLPHDLRAHVEDARAAHLRELGDVARFPHWIARDEWNFRAPVYLGDPLALTLRIVSVGRTSFRFSFRIHHRADGRVLADGESVHVAVNDLGRPTEIPESFRQHVRADR